MNGGGMGMRGGGSGSGGGGGGGSGGSGGSGAAAVGRERVGDVESDDEGGTEERGRGEARRLLWRMFARRGSTEGRSSGSSSDVRRRSGSVRPGVSSGSGKLRRAASMEPRREHDFQGKFQGKGEVEISVTLSEIAAAEKSLVGAGPYHSYSVADATPATAPDPPPPPPPTRAPPPIPHPHPPSPSQSQSQCYSFSSRESSRERTPSRAEHPAEQEHIVAGPQYPRPRSPSQRKQKQSSQRTSQRTSQSPSQSQRTQPAPQARQARQGMDDAAAAQLARMRSRMGDEVREMDLPYHAAILPKTLPKTTPKTRTGPPVSFLGMQMQRQRKGVPAQPAQLPHGVNGLLVPPRLAGRGSGSFDANANATDAKATDAAERRSLEFHARFGGGVGVRPPAERRSLDGKGKGRSGSPYRTWGGDLRNGGVRVGVEGRGSR